jgi:hypothetical protein
MSIVGLHEPIPDMRQRLCGEFIRHLGVGPFLGEDKQASLADLSAYPIVVSGYLMGMKGVSLMLSNAQVVAWCR